jgi:cbb3-type cytochrome oxidase maturation protein
MSIVLLLAPAALFLAGIFLAAFLWGADRGQYEDLDSPAQRILFEGENERERNL